MDILLPVIAWVLVWVAGAALVAALPRSPGSFTAPGEIAWLVGTGFFAGAFLMTVWMRTLSLASIPLDRGSVGLPLALLAAAGAWRVRRRADPSLPSAWHDVLAALGGRGLDGRSRLLWFALLAWLAFRSLLLFAEVATQPLYPWDAWTQWATKARVWFELKAWVPFVSTDAWLAAKGALYTDAAPTYPATVPLWQVWSSLALGRYDDAWMNLPWWFTAVAFGIAIYGALRRIEFGPLAALVGTWIVVSLPLADVHVALAGYADLPMAAYFTLAALATLAWTRSRSRYDAALALMFALACPFIKTPGVVWAVTLVPAFVVALLPRRGVRVVAAGFALGIAALMVLAQTSPIILNYQLHLDFAPAWGALLESFFMLGNWNLLWYGVIAATLLAGPRLSSIPLAPFAMIMAAGVLFLSIVFAFTNARQWVETQTTINRAVLHLAPLAAVWMLCAFQAWATRTRAIAPAAAAA
jgi:hypothetical protein